jgi:hypothetical protein
MDRSRRRLEETGLRRPRRSSLRPGQLQQPKQAGVLGPERRQLLGHRRRSFARESLGHAANGTRRRSPDGLNSPVRIEHADDAARRGRLAGRTGAADRRPCAGRSRAVARIMVTEAPGGGSAW